MRRIQTTFGIKTWIIAAAIGFTGWSVQAAEAPISEAGQTDPFEIVALGDSLSAGYLLPPGTGFPEQLARALKAKGHNVNVMNAGVSGDTSTGGLARLDWAVGPETDALILELGSNDALRGIEPDVTRANLDAILQPISYRVVRVLLRRHAGPAQYGG